MSGDARTLQPRVLDAIRRGSLWESGHKVAVAVSGGVDSLVLLHLLHRTQSAHGGKLMVMSADHGLRKESEAEVEGVRAVLDEMAVDLERSMALCGARRVSEIDASLLTPASAAGS